MRERGDVRRDGMHDDRRIGQREAASLPTRDPRHRTAEYTFFYNQYKFLGVKSDNCDRWVKYTSFLHLEGTTTIDRILCQSIGT